jgi:hypothetical protein
VEIAGRPLLGKSLSKRHTDMPPVTCKDCGKLATVVVACGDKVCPGPRCLKCWRIEKRRRSKAAHSKSVEAKYGISGADYDALYEAQGGRCALCRRATGARKRLAVDHDHKTGAVRGLLCGHCNREIIGRSGDDPEFFERAAEYLRNPPAREVLNVQADRPLVQEQGT